VSPRLSGAGHRNHCCANSNQTTFSRGLTSAAQVIPVPANAQRPGRKLGQGVGLFYEHRSVVTTRVVYRPTGVWGRNWLARGRGSKRPDPGLYADRSSGPTWAGDVVREGDVDLPDRCPRRNRLCPYKRAANRQEDRAGGKIFREKTSVTTAWKGRSTLACSCLITRP
jgi:hypothetical protein